jgi:hypothetical protein
MKCLNRGHTTEEESRNDRAYADGRASARRARLGGGGGGRCGSARGAAGSAGATGAAGARRRGGALGGCLEGGNRLIWGRVEGEDHAGLAVSRGLAVEPGGVGVLDRVVVGPGRRNAGQGKAGV